MPTVIDSLVLELGLDDKSLKDGAKLTIEVLNKTKSEAVKSGKTIEDASQKAANSITKITTAVLGLYAALVGARSIKDFAADLTTANAALGRFASNMQEAPQTIAAWSMAAQRFGGSSEGVAATFDRIGRSLFELKQNGQLLPKEFSQLQAWAGMRIDTDKGVNKFLEDTSAAIKRLNEIDPSRVKFIADGLGIDTGTLEVMKRYGSEVGAYLETLKKNAPSDAAIKAAQKLQEQWASLQQTATGLAQAVMTTLSPEIEKILKQMTDWIEANQEWLRTEIVDGVKKFADYLSQIDWQAVGQGLANFANGAREVTEAIGGIERATVALIALWAGSKALGMLSSLRGLVSGGTAASGAAGAGAAAGASGMGILSRVLAAAGLGYAAYEGARTITDPSKELQDAPRSKWGVDDVLRLAYEKYKASNADAGPDKQPDYTSLTRDPGAHGERLMGDVKVEGRSVSKSNPLPVEVKEKPAEPGFLDTLFNGAKQLLGFGSAAAATLPSGEAQTSTNTGASSRSAGPSGVAYEATNLRQAMGISQTEYNAFREGLTDIEGKRYDRMGGYRRRYAGRYQMGPAEITETAARLGVPRPRTEDFLKDPDMQERFFENYTLDHYRSLMKNPKFASMSKDEQLKMLGYAHNQGVGGAKKYLNTGVAGRDAWGTSGTAYFGPIGRRLKEARSKEEAAYRDPMVSAPNGVITGAAGSAMANNVNNNSNTTNTSSVSATIGTMNVNAPNATDAKGVAGGMVDGLRTTIPALSNYGPR